MILLSIIGWITWSVGTGWVHNSSPCRELLDDSNFHTALQRVSEEPVPFFRQFSSQSSSHTDSQQAVAVMSSTTSGHPLLAVGGESTVNLTGGGEEEKDKIPPSLEKQERGRDEASIDVETLKRYSHLVVIITVQYNSAASRENLWFKKKIIVIIYWPLHGTALSL